MGLQGADGGSGTARRMSPPPSAASGTKWISNDRTLTGELGPGEPPPGCGAGAAGGQGPRGRGPSLRPQGAAGKRDLPDETLSRCRRDRN